MKFFKIYVQEEKPVLSIKKSQCKEIEIEVFEELPKDGSFHIMQEYDGSKRKTMRIGVQAEEAARVEIKGTWGNSVLLNRSENEKNIWYEKSVIWTENGFEEKSESIFGINSCGEWTVTAYGVSGSILYTEKVKIIPRLLTLEQYNLMQMEVKKLFEELAYQPNSTDKRTIIKELNVALFPLEQLEEFLAEWKEWLHQIEKNPAEVLQLEKEKKKRFHIKKWDANTILETKLFPYREKLSTRSFRKDTHLIEHKMIRWMLERTNERIEQEKEIEKSAYGNLAEISDNLKKLNTSSEWNNDVALEKIIKRKQQIQKDIALLKKRKKKWEKLFVVVTEYLNLPLFDVQEEEPEWTHLFISHPIYRSIFETYEQIIDLSPTLTSRERDFEKAMVSSPHLYEVWILFQLIHQLKKVQFNSKEIALSMIEHFEEKGTLSGWKKSFNSPRGSAGLYYEKECLLENGKKAKPDYMLIFKDSNDVWNAHILDAKYKPYTLMSEGVLTNDIEHSSRRYLSITDKNIEIKSAALIHIDKETENWNIDADRNYSVSHFYAQPASLENIQTYMKRIFHFFNNQLNMCPNCGKAAEHIQQGYKSTYICNPCNEVWVENTCRRNFHPQPQVLPKLLKYPSGNYNIQVGDQWNVYCPVCSRETNGNRIQQNIFGNRL